MLTQVPYDFGVSNIVADTKGTHTHEIAVEISSYGDIAEYCVLLKGGSADDCNWLSSPLPSSITLPASIAERGYHDLVFWVKNRSGVSRSFDGPTVRFRVEGFDAVSVIAEPLLGTMSVAILMP
jgi:hypothetical protein